MELNPFNVQMHVQLASMYYAAKRVDESIAQAKRALALKPDYGRAYVRLVECYVDKGMYEEALAAARRSGGNYSAFLEALVRARAGNGDKAIALLEQAKDPKVPSPARRLELAQLAAAVGRTEDVFRFLEEAFRQRDFGLVSVANSRHWEPLRQDPRFSDLVRRIGIR